MSRDGIMAGAKMAIGNQESGSVLLGKSHSLVITWY